MNGQFPHAAQDIVYLVHTSFCCLQHVVGLLYVSIGLLHTSNLIVHPLRDSQASRIVGRFIDTQTGWQSLDVPL